MQIVPPVAGSTNTAGAPWGATVADWDHFARTLGLESDLLPVVSNPNAKISEKSKMRDLGKTPSRYNQAGEVVGIPAWTQHVATDKDIARWARHSDQGICVQTREIRAIDIDIADPVAAARVRDLVELGCGALPLRRRPGTGKCLLAFRMPGDFSKRIIRTEHGLIEFLATGQQFIAIGTHTSGTRYEWVDVTGEITLPAEIPELTPAEFEVLWQALVEAFALPDGESRARQGIVPTRPRTSTDLQDPMVAWLAENGWVTGYDRSGRVDVRCPWEGEHTSDSGPTSTSWFPAGVGGFAQGHFRCLHAHCTSRTDGDFLEATGYAADGFDVVEVEDKDVQPHPPFTYDRSGSGIKAELNNVLMALRRPDLVGYDIGFDEFRSSMMIGAPGTEWRPFTDDDYTLLRSKLASGGFKPIGSEMMKDAARFIARERSFDSARQWAERLEWDGVARVEQFFPRYFGVKDTPYARAVGAYTWTGLAGRCVDPGVKADMVPVLIGLQGTGKTSAVEALCPIPEGFVEVDLTRKDDDIARALRGKLVGEIAELKGLASRDAESIKAWVSRRTEEWVPKFREFTSRYPRRLLLIGTGNREGFLDDETGERRWLPLTVGAVDLDAVRADRDQLWAEGVVLFKQGGVQWQDAQRLATFEHGHYKVGDVWEDTVRDWLGRDDMDGGKRADGYVRLVDVLTSALGFKVNTITRRDELRAGKVLRALGLRKTEAPVDGEKRKVWVADAAARTTFHPSVPT